MSAPDAATPVLVELFTSEGCSSCPPADALLAELASSHSNVVALSEHVSYWNGLGWKDPFSSDVSTKRQEQYAARMGGEGPYTPEMVVNGQRAFVGSDQGSANRALGAVSQEPHLALSATAVSSVGPNEVQARVVMGTAPVDGEVLSVLTQNLGVTVVPRGENGGRTLRHVDIAREFAAPVKVRRGTAYAGPVKFLLPAGMAASEFHVVTFFQAGPGGPVLAVASTAAGR